MVCRQSFGHQRLIFTGQENLVDFHDALDHLLALLDSQPWKFLQHFCEAHVDNIGKFDWLGKLRHDSCGNRRAL